MRNNKTGPAADHQALRNKEEKSVKKEESIDKDGNNNDDRMTLVNENEKSDQSLNNKSRTTKIDFRFSEEVEPEWRMPRDNSNKISWVKPLMSSSLSTSSCFNVVLFSTTFLIFTFCQFAQFLN